MIEDDVQFVRETLLGVKSLLTDRGELKKRIEQQCRFSEGVFAFASLHKFFRDYAFFRHVVNKNTWDVIDDISGIRKLVDESSNFALKSLRVSEAQKGVIRLSEDVDSLLSLITKNNLSDGLKFAYQRYKQTSDKIAELHKVKTAEISKILNIHRQNQYYIKMELYEQIKSDKSSESLLETLNNFTKSHGFFIKEGSQYVSFKPTSEVGLFLDGWFRDKKHNTYIIKFPDYNNFIPLSLEQDILLDWSEFQEKMVSKTGEEINQYLRDKEKILFGLENLYDVILEEAKRFDANKQLCLEEFKNIWLMVENRPKQLIIQKTKAHSKLKLSVKFGNVAVVLGETYVNSDLEDCSSFIRFEGEIEIFIDERGIAQSFIDINLWVDSEYDGWNEEELEERILEFLQEGYVFELV